MPDTVQPDLGIPAVSKQATDRSIAPNNLRGKERNQNTDDSLPRNAGEFSFLRDRAIVGAAVGTHCPALCKWHGAANGTSVQNASPWNKWTAQKECSPSEMKGLLQQYAQFRRFEAAFEQQHTK